MKNALLIFGLFACIALLMPEKSEAQFFPHNDTTYTFVSTTNAFGRIQSYDGEDGRYESADDKMIDRFYQLVGLNSNYVWNPNSDPDFNILDTLYYDTEEAENATQYFRELIMDNSFRSNPPLDINISTLVRMFEADAYGLVRFGVTNVEDSAQEFQFSVLLRGKVLNMFGSETYEYDETTGRIYIFNSNGAIGIQALDRTETGVSLIDFSDYDSTDPIRDNARDFARWDEITKTTFDSQVSMGPDGGWAFMNFGSTGALAPEESYTVWVAFTHGADLDVVDMRLDAAVDKYNDISTSIDEPFERPVVMELLQNYPNPFNPSTNISFNLPDAADVNLSVYNVLGQKVATLVNGTRAAGSHTATFDASRLNSGMYIYRLTSNGQSLSRTMMLVK